MHFGRIAADVCVVVAMLTSAKVMAARCFDEEIILSQRPRMSLMRDEEGFDVHLLPDMAVVNRKGFVMRFDRQPNVPRRSGVDVFSLRFLDETYLFEIERMSVSEDKGRWKQYNAGAYPRGFAGTCVLDDFELRD